MISFSFPNWLLIAGFSKYESLYWNSICFYETRLRLASFCIDISKAQSANVSRLFILFGKYLIESGAKLLAQTGSCPTLFCNKESHEYTAGAYSNVGSFLSEDCYVFKDLL